MPYKFRYRLIGKVEELLLNKRAMIAIAIMAPIMFSLSAMYLGGYFGEIYFPTPKIPEINLFKKNEITREIPEIVEPKESVFEDNLKPIYGQAVELEFPSISKKIPLQTVGLDQNEALEVPKDWQSGGWYKYGSRPGETGNVIVDAHYDDNFGKPAAFWELKNLKVDDKVFMKDEYGQTHTYSVTESFLVSINDPDRLQIFESDDDSAILTMVTCGGVWVQGKSTYDKRLIVRAELVRN